MEDLDTKIGQLREHSRMEMEKLEEKIEQVNARLHKMEKGLESLGDLIRQLVGHRVES